MTQVPKQELRFHKGSGRYIPLVNVIAVAVGAGPLVLYGINAGQFDGSRQAIVAMFLTGLVGSAALGFRSPSGG
jgi:hypothetical protein